MSRLLDAMAASGAPGATRETARLLARTFFRELVEHGFEAVQIVAISSELIELVSENMHRRRTPPQP